MRSDLLTLKLFIGVYEELSLVKAADREHIAPSALSKRISDLEASIGTALFYRTRNGLEATPAADALVSHARLIMRDVHQMESELADFAAGLKGHVRVWSNIWGIVEYLPEDLAGFLATHVKIDVDLREDVSSAIVRAVEENAADIGVIAGEVHAPGLHLAHYRTDRLVAVMAEGHPLAARANVKLADMSPFELIRANQRESAIEQLITRFLPASVNIPRARIGVSGFEAVCRMAETGLGIGIVPERSAARYRHGMKIAVIALDESWAKRALNICFGDPGTLPGAARLLIEHLKNQDL